MGAAMGWTVDWFAYGRHGVATALRGMAATLESLADWIEGSEPPPRTRRRDASTRQRIAATLDRARSGYARATAPAHDRR